MPWIATEELEPEQDLGRNVTYWVYNGLDTCLTYEVHEKLYSIMGQYPDCQGIYDFERAMQWPALDMMLRGFLVDQSWRATMIATLDSERLKYEGRLNALAEAVWGKSLNARSPAQLKDFFANHLRIPIPVKKVKGEQKESLDRKSLESLLAYYYAKPFIGLILAIRDRSKSLGTLRSGVDPDGRIRTSYNVASTETGRWSSSENAFGTGTNLQNWTERLRRCLVADPGFKLAYIDLEQAESRATALLLYHYLTLIEDECRAQGIEPPAYCADKAKYLEACESGDLHTTVAMMTWPELPWTDDLSANKKIADDKSRPFYRDFTFRDIAKRLGHGSNYRGSPFGMSQIIAVESKVIAEFQAKYFEAFPLPAYHQKITELVQVEGVLTTPLGRRRQFFGRRTDDATIREAIAFQPQSMVGDLLNLGLWKVWNHYKGSKDVQMLGQVHDAIVIQYRESLEDEVIAKVSELIRVPVNLGDRTMVIPNDVQVGWNFAKSSDKLFADGNPDGLIGYKGPGHDKRKRSAATSLLDHVIR